MLIFIHHCSLKRLLNIDFRKQKLVLKRLKSSVTNKLCHSVEIIHKLVIITTTIILQFATTTSMNTAR